MVQITLNFTPLKRNPSKFNFLNHYILKCEHILLTLLYWSEKFYLLCYIENKFGSIIWDVFQEVDMGEQGVCWYV